MAEIKNNFSQGKMNKDLDERIVPVGQYRDAMNIQVSTSENSEVGTAQNILGNYLIPGQDFIDNTSMCVGAIADEKNDKLYYFVTNSEDLISNGDFSLDVDGGGNPDGWGLGTGWSWNSTNQIIEGNSVSLYSKINQGNLPVNTLIVGQTYEISFTVSSYVQGNIKVNLYNENGDGIIIDEFTPTNKTYTFREKVESSITTNTNYYSRFWIQRYGSTGFTGNIDNISIIRSNSYIIEYDCKTSTITPVLVDINGDTLNFNPNNIITGINIIDDTLMWTDNINEPKKINITRCKAGTDISNPFATHTKLVVNNIVTSTDIQEQHVTVIKKRPVTAPKISVNTPVGYNELSANCDFSQGSSSIDVYNDVPFNDSTNQYSIINNAGGDGVNLVAPGDFSYVRMRRIVGEYGANIQSTLKGNLISPPGVVQQMATPKNFHPNYYFGIDPFDGGESNSNFPVIHRKDYDNGSVDDIYFNNDAALGQYVRIELDNMDPFAGAYGGDAWLQFRLFNDAANGPYTPASSQEHDWLPGEKLYFKFRWYSDETHDETLTLHFLDYVSGASNTGFGANYVSMDSKDFNRDASDAGTTVVKQYTFTVPSSHDGGLIRLALVNGGNTIIGHNAGNGFDYIRGIQIEKTHEVVVPPSYYEPTDELVVPSSSGIQLGDMISAPGFSANTHVLNATTVGSDTTLKLSHDPDPNVYPTILASNWPANQWAPVINSAGFQPSASYNVGDVLLLSHDSQPGTLPSNFQVRGSIVGIYTQTGTPGFLEYTLEIDSIDNTVQTDDAEFDTMPYGSLPGLMYKTTHGVAMNLVKEIEEDRLFEEKFVRFATRWKYEDGEYSAFSPFTDVAFNASTFAFHPTKNTYNLGLQNNCENIDLLNIIPAGIPEDVVQVDILIKPENSTTIYSLDSIKPDDPIPTNQTNNDWNSNTTPAVDIYDSYTIVSGVPTVTSLALPTANMGKYAITKENIHAALPANQFLRPWDNVPRRALAQEVTSNRIVYGNYTQGYNMISDDNSIVKPEINASYRQRSFDINSDIDFTTGKRSLKTFRTYQLGIVYGDEYGRETPVFTSKTASIKIPWDADNTTAFNGNASRSIQLTSIMRGKQPSFAKYYKIFVKQNSSEYYNLSMDRVYKAENPENLWISFPSSDVNKVEKEDYLILKKQADKELQVPINNKFKVVDIKNEAPDYVKYSYIEVGNVGTPSTLFPNYSGPLNLPQESDSQIIIFKNLWIDGGGSALEDIDEKLSFQFSIQAGTNRIESSRYEILNIELFDDNSSFPKYRFKLDKPITETDGFAVSSGVVDTSLKISIKKLTPRESSEFEGRFFVKIISDSITNAYLEPLIVQQTSYRLTTTMPLYYFADEQADYSNNEDHSDGIANATSPYTENTKTLHSENKSNTEGAWNDLLDFGLAQLTPNFFIDKTYMAAAQPIDLSDLTGQTGRLDANQSGRLWLGDGTDGAGNALSSTVVDSVEGVIDTSGLSAYDKTVFGERCWTNTADPNNPSYNVPDDSYEPSDPQTASRFFMHLSIGPVGNDLHDGDFNTMTSGALRWKGIGRGNFGHGSNVSLGVNLPQTTQTDVDNYNSQWEIKDSDQAAIANKIVAGAKFRFVGSEEIFTILKVSVKRLYNHTAFMETKIWDGTSMINAEDNVPSPSIQYLYNEWDNDSFGSGSERDALKQGIEDFGKKTNRRLLYIIELDKDPNDTAYNVSPYSNRDVDSFESIRFFDEIIADGASDSPTTPAIWETKQKDDVDLDIYYEASGAIPISLKDSRKSNAELFAPIGSRVKCGKSGSMPTFPTNAAGLSLVVTNWHTNSDGKYNIVEIASPGLNVDTSVAYTNNSTGLAAQTDKFEYKVISFFREDGSFTSTKIYQVVEITGNYITKLALGYSTTGSNRTVGLSYYDCFCFGNGVESNRIRDDFNAMTISKGVKASATLEEQYKEENRKHGLIYSGIYNSTSGVNNLNQFIQAEKITKDLNPTYGSIQKLFQRRVSLVALCEDRIVQITAGKDTLYNADGKPQLISSNAVLGDANPFVGDYGISKNPESFAKESYRAYFTDKQRGAVLRLSMDGLTPISSAGMTDYFKDNLANANSIIGSYNNSNKAYNLTLSSIGLDLSRGIGSPNQSPVNSVTVSYNEPVKGWSSFKSFIPEFGLSSSNDYFTFNQGQIWKHNAEIDNNSDPVLRNQFYGQTPEPSTITSVLNSNPSMIKSYNTLNYEGSEGWIGTSIITDQQAGTVNEFIEKEGKWFNYIRGEANTIDLQAFNFQGIGEPTTIEYNI